jgi:hypothetical protein
MSGNRELGEFLRSRRARLRPDDVGIVAQRRRRAPGLRAEWYIRLEQQGRAVSPSEETGEALGQALSLNAVERQHLRSLAREARRGPFGWS